MESVESVDADRFANYSSDLDLDDGATEFDNWQTKCNQLAQEIKTSTNAVTNVKYDIDELDSPIHSEQSSESSIPDIDVPLVRTMEWRTEDDLESTSTSSEEETDADLEASVSADVLSRIALMQQLAAHPEVFDLRDCLMEQLKLNQSEVVKIGVDNSTDCDECRELFKHSDIMRGVSQSCKSPLIESTDLYDV